MTSLLVESVAMNAHRGLYLTADMLASSAHLLNTRLISPAKAMHLSQPYTTDFEHFSEVVTDAHQLWCGLVANSSSLSTDEYLAFGRMLMVASDLSLTHTQITNGLRAASDLALAIFLRTKDNSDAFTANYPRAIPASLADLTIDCIDDITEATYKRIFTAEPWISWFERLRAQRQRTMKTLAEPDAIERSKGCWDRIVAEVKPVKNRYRKRVTHEARRTVRKSSDMFQRFLGRETLKAFLESANETPLHIAGCNYNYQLVKRRNTLLNKSYHVTEGVATVGTSVFNKNGDRLCELCVFFQDTPILDTVLAFVMHVQNAETELELLDAACVISAPSRFYDDPVLPGLKMLTDPALAPILVDNVQFYAACHQPLRETVQRETLHHAYLAFLKINRFGKQYLPTLRCCGEFDFWEYVRGDASARAFMHLAQTNMARGLM